MTQMNDELNIEETGLAQHTVRGMVWTLVQTLGSKAAGVVAQIFLARLLSHSDWGLVAATYAAAALPNVFRMTGVSQILVAKQKQFRRWAVHAFWFEIALGMVSSVGMCIAAPIAATVFKAPELLYTTLIIAVAAGINSLGVLSNAATLIQLQFRNISLVNLYVNIFQSGLSVILAFCHFGAYSFIIPVPIGNAIKVFAMWWLVHNDLPPIRWEINLLRWRKLAKDSSVLMLASLGPTITYMAYPAALRKFHTIETVGLWFFAWNLSNQIIQLLANNLTMTLFPTLSKIKNKPERQKAGFMRAAQALVLITTFACILEALTAYPGLELLFGTKWLAAVVPLQIFSLATVFGVVGSPINSIIMAQERYRLYLWYNILPPLALIPLLYLGSWRYGVAGVATATLVQAAVVAPLGVALVAGGAGKPDWLSPLKVFWGSLFCGAVAGVVVLIVMNSLPILSKNNIVVIIVICGVFSLIYLALAWLVCRPIMKELLSHTIHLLYRFLPHK
ncbi:MAG TPA: oligosaccharide flippase family protein [Phycisphaerae bacterium]|nr:oligosaccharide flippase family protein [Phycisphaerae bacterium]